MDSSTPTVEYASKPAPASRGSALVQLLSIPEIGALIPLVIVTAVFGILTPAMLHPESIASILRAIQFIGIIVVGQTILMIAGEIDLSVGSVAGFCSMVVTAVIKLKIGAGPLPLIAAMLAGVLAGTLVGFINGIITVKLGVPAFIATLGMLFAAGQGGAYLVANQTFRLSPVFEQYGLARPLGVSWTFFILLTLVIVADLAMRFTTLGRMIYATGGNREVAKLAGINTDWVKIGCFMLTGTLAGLSGLLITATFNLGQPATGLGWELDVIAAVVLGGTSLFGGMGTIAGAFMGLLIMQSIRTGLVMAGGNTDPHWQPVVIGAIMIAAVAFDVLRRKAKIG